MKNKSKLVIVTICISLIAILSISSYVLFNIKDHKEISNPKEVTGLAVLVDGEKTDTFPTKDSGKVFDKIECTNGGEAEWNSDTWKLAVRHINRSTECTVSFITKVPTAVEKLTELAKTNTTEMFIDDTEDKNLRYMGKDPANYVDIENGNDAEGNPILWRIIGVMNNVDDGTGKTETRLKVIRDESIGKIAWNSSDDNSWETSSLNTVLNGDYYERIGDYSEIGITDNMKLLLDNAAYYLETEPYSGNSNTTYNALNFYKAERKNKIKIIRKIGLMYPSDYGLASSGGETASKAVCDSYSMARWYYTSNADCRNNNWLNKLKMSQWTMTRFNYSVALGISQNGVLSEITLLNSNVTVQPVAYLKSDVKITGGEGTKENPYKLGI